VQTGGDILTEGNFRATVTESFAFRSGITEFNSFKRNRSLNLDA
jgi:hypothetical protein